MGMIPVDAFFKRSKYGFRQTDDYDIPSKKNRRSIRALDLEEASDVFGISFKDDEDIRKRIFEKYKVTE
jgi:hypothetical protein